MKRILCLFLIFFLLFCAVSCNDAIQNNETTTLPQTPATPADTLRMSAELIYTRTDPNDGLYFEAFYDDVYFVNYSPPIGPDDPLPWTHKYKVYYAQTGEFKDCGEIENVPFYSGKTVILEGRYYYDWLSRFDNDRSDIASLVRVDAKNDTTEIVLDREDTPNIQIPISKLNEEEIVWLIANISENGDQRTSIIERYNIKTLEHKTLDEKSYQANTENNETYDVISACDGKIYAIGRELFETHYESYLYIMDSDGNVISEIECSSTIGNAPALGELHVIGDYAIIKKSSTASDFIFKIEDEKLVAVPINITEEGYNEGLLFASGIANISSAEKTPYLYYRCAYISAHGKKGTPVIYALNTKSGESKEINVALDDDYQYLNYMCMDEKGNLMLSFIQDTESRAEKIYKLSAEALHTFLES